MRRQARARLGRLVTLGAALTVVGVSVVGAIAAATEDGKAPERAAISTVRASNAAEPDSRARNGTESAVPGNPSTAAAEPEPVTREPRAVPEAGSGRFRVAPGPLAVTSDVHVVYYTVEVEDGLPLKLARVAQAVESVLNERRSWAATGSVSVRRVSTDPDVRIRIATPETTDTLCQPLDTGGRLSCRNGELVVLNAWRWVNGATTYQGDLVAYRQYMVNHEFGHALGNAHESCPGFGELAPVMLQQTKGLDGCLPNPWPRTGE